MEGLRMHQLGFATQYSSYNELLQDSAFYEDEEEGEDYIRTNFTTEDVLDENEDFEDIMFHDEQPEQSPAKASEEEFKSKRTTVDEFFRCMICYENAVKPLMCPYCSKFCCAKCFKTWLSEHNCTCPCCRRAIDTNSLVKVRFMCELNEVRANYEKAVNNILSGARGVSESKGTGAGLCQQHEQEMKYFCKNCSMPICSDCAMFGKEHKGHEFDHLKNIYDHSIGKLRNRIGEAQTKVTHMHQAIKEIDGIMKKLKVNRKEKKERITQVLEKIWNKIDKEYQEKILTLKAQKRSLIKEYKEFKSRIDAVTSKIIGSNKVDIVISSPMIEQKIMEINEKSVPEFKLDPSIFRYSNDELLTSDYHTYILKPFSAYAKADIVYSDLVIINGCSWRLKVYPNGNAPHKGHKGCHLSVFVEMVKGWPNVLGSYDYRIELVNRLDKSKRIIREHVAEFETNTCWGYTKFIKLGHLERDNFLIPEEDLLEFRFYVYPSNELQLITDLRFYIESLETSKREQAEVIKQLREGNQPHDLSTDEINEKPIPQQSHSWPKRDWIKDDRSDVIFRTLGREALDIELKRKSNLLPTVEHPLAAVASSGIMEEKAEVAKKLCESTKL